MKHCTLESNTPKYLVYKRHLARVDTSSSAFSNLRSRIINMGFFQTASETRKFLFQFSPKILK